jgi:hypothetical protein
VTIWLTADAVPALGDMRAAGRGTVFFLKPGVVQRADWGRYQDALAQAISRGAEVVWATR